MFCRNCGKEVPEQAAICVSCGCVPKSGKNFCPNCGAETNPYAVVCVKCGVKLTSAGDTFKPASQDALQAFKIFSVNPVGGLERAFETLGKSRAIGVGIVFAAIFDFCILIGTFLFFRRFTRFMDEFLGPLLLFSRRETFMYLGRFANNAFQFFKLLILGAVPFVSITAASAIARKIFRGAGSFAGDIFIAGASLLPLGFFVLLSSILGVKNIEVITVLAVFAICYTILMIYSGCTKISNIPEAGAALAVPIMLLLSGWLWKIIFNALF